MKKVTGFGSTSSGDISGFTNLLQEHEETVSFTLDDGFHFKDDSYFRVLHQIEPPEVLDAVDRIIKYHKFYDLILAWNHRVLEACPNAVLFPQSVCTWMCFGPASARDFEPDVSLKKFQASFLTSSKAWTPGHILRQQVYDRLPSSVLDLKIDKFKSPPWIPDKRAILNEYQFTITPQNAYHVNWFDDKIMDAFMSKTIPLYWGCPNIGDYFNLDGIIRFETIEELMCKLTLLTPDYYERHFAAVEDNYERAVKRVHTWSRVDEAIAKGLDRKKNGGWSHEDMPSIVTIQRERRIRRPLNR